MASGGRRASGRGGGGGPGLRDVAVAAGVSMMTVSRALRGIDGVSAATRARVAEIAHGLGYVPDGHARALAAAGSRLIGISVPNLYNDVFAGILGGLRDTLGQAGYSSVVDTTDYDLVRERDWVERMAVWRPAGLVLTGCAHDPGLRRLLAPGAVPVVEVWDVSDAPLDLCVGIDHRAAGRQIAQHVAALGYRRPAVVGLAPGVDPRADGRAEGIAETFAGRSAPLRRIDVAGANAFVAGAEGARAVLADPPGARPDALFFHNDNMAFGGLCALEASGLAVPEAIGVVGFNGLDLTRVLPRPITTLETPRAQIGRLAGQHLLARLNGLAPPPRSALPCRLVPGATVRAVGAPR